MNGVSKHEKSEASLLQRITTRMIDELANGKFSIGDVLPPQKEWAQRFGVSSFTVSRAFTALKDRSIVESDQGSYTKLCKIPLRVAMSADHREITGIDLWHNPIKDVRQLSWLLQLQTFRREFAAR